MGYRPLDAMEFPRFEGIRTFMRLPHATTTEGTDFAVVGVPFDTGATFRVGARFGPAAIRAASLLLRPYNSAQGIDVFAHCSGVDRGDVPVVPGNTAASLERIEAAMEPVFAAGVVPICLGGDHTIPLALLRAAHRRYGPLALIHFDSHADTWDSYWGERYTHGTTFRRAIEEGLIDPARSTQIGMRGPGYGPGDINDARALGLRVIPDGEMHALGFPRCQAIARERAAPGPAWLSFDIDWVDPAYAPGTGTPEVGGVTSREALMAVRGLTGIRFVGFDIVEVLPALDHAEITAMLAANIAYECLTLHAIARHNAHGTRG